MGWTGIDSTGLGMHQRIHITYYYGTEFRSIKFQWRAQSYYIVVNCYYISLCYSFVEIGEPIVNQKKTKKQKAILFPTSDANTLGRMSKSATNLQG